jgi:hypothetical protein
VVVLLAGCTAPTTIRGTIVVPEPCVQCRFVAYGTVTIRAHDATIGKVIEEFRRQRAPEIRIDFSPRRFIHAGRRAS